MQDVVSAVIELQRQFVNIKVKEVIRIEITIFVTHVKCLLARRR
jgi:hypothetical protein